MAEIAYGAKLQINDGAGSSYQDVSNVTSISPPAAEVGTVESTHLLSPARYKEYIAGLVEPGELQATLHYTTSEYSRLVALRGVSKTFKVIFNDDQNVTFAGFITKIEPTIGGPEELKTINFTVKVNGAITVNNTSSS
jgi:hypothetical protein